MYKFENYTLVVHETSSEYYGEIPEHRFLSHLKEIPESSLHAYGCTQEDAIRNLREQFEELAFETESSNATLPAPKVRDLDDYSGRIVLRMPPWLHKLVESLADDEKTSINTYIVNRLIKTSTMEEMCQTFALREEKFLQDLSWTFHEEVLEIKPIKSKVWPIGTFADQTSKPSYNLRTLKKVG